MEPIDWVNLAKSQVTFPNMQLYELKEGMSLGSVMSTVNSMPSTKALLLINIDNTFEVNSEFHPNDENPSVPILVVTKEVGALLIELVEANPRAVEVKVELKEAGIMEEVGQPEIVSQTSGEEYAHILYSPSAYPLSIL